MADGTDPSSPPADAVRFLNLFGADRGATYQTFDDNAQRKDSRLARVLHGSIASVHPSLAAANAAGAGVFWQINEGSLDGPRKAERITRVRACVMDADRVPVDNVLASLRAAGIRQHAHVQTSGEKGHLYILLADCPLARFRHVQKSLAAKFGTDAAVCDLSRVMRLPGYYHRKGAPFLVRLVSISEHPPYRTDEVLERLGLPLGADNESHVRVASRSEQERDPQAYARGCEIAATFEPAIEGGGGSRQTIVVANRLMDAGNDVPTTVEILGDWFNPRCIPPWDQPDLAAIVQRAEKARIHPVGCYSASAEFTAIELPDMPAPVRVFPESRMPSDADLAGSFTAQHGDSVLYCEEMGRALHWDGTRFTPDATNQLRHLVRLHIERAADHVRNSILAEGADKKPEADRAAARIASARTVFAVETFVRADPVHAVAAHAFDSDPWLLNTRDGIVDLRSGKLLAHDRSARMSKITAAGFGGPCDVWLSLIDHVVAGDELYRRFLQKLAGYALTGSVREQIFAFIYGPGGTGKSRFTEGLSHAMGGYSCTAAPSLFTTRGDTQHPTALAALRGMRLALAPETEQGSHWNEPLLKGFTAGDRMTARFMRQDNFEFTPEALLIFTGNHQPHARNVSDGGLRRRMLLLPFDRKPTAPDKDLQARLAAESAGILAWAAEGTRLWLTEGLQPPPIVQAATASYFEAEDDVGRWLSERVEPDSNAFCETVALYSDWTAWAQAGGMYVGAVKRLVAEMARRDYQAAKHPRNRRAGFRGVRLRHPFAQPDGST